MDGNENTNDWRESLPENVRGWDEAKNADSPDAFFKQIGDLRSHLGNSIRVPTDDAGDETRQEFFEKLQRKVPEIMRRPDMDNDDVMKDVWASLGKPQEADHYDLPEIGEYKISDDKAAALKKLALDSNLTKKQFKQLTQGLLQDDADRQRDAAAELERMQGELKRDWGDALDSRMETVRRIAEQSNAPETLLKALEEGTADSATVKWLYDFSKQFAEDSPIKTQMKEIDSPQDIQGKIDDIMNNNQHPYWITNHPQHSAAVNKMLDLRKKLAV